MAAFEFIALNQQGHQKTGVQEADSSRQVRQNLRDMGWSPISVSMVTSKSDSSKTFSLFQQRVSAVELAVITRQLATLIQAALPVEEALYGVASQQEKTSLKNLLMAIRGKVIEGYTLAQGLESFTSIFSNMYRATVSAGEHSGHLDKVLNSLADYTEERMAAQQKVQQALLYPIILMLAATGIVGFLLGFVVPEVIQVFIDADQELPWITSALIAASNWLQSYWYMLLIVIAIFIFVIKRLLKESTIRLSWHKAVLDLPIVGKFVRMSNAARFASTLSMLTSSGVSLIEALAIAARVLGNDAIRHAVAESSRRVSEGVSLSKALSETKFFPPLMLHMISSGESSGTLDSMLEKVATNQQREVNARIAMLLGLFEPLMLVVMGGVVMAIVLAILLPILNMNQLM